MTDKVKKAGRPKGSRSKTNLMKAQLMVDDFSVEAVKNIIALAKNDSNNLLKMKGKVPATIILTANKTLLDKSVVNEKEKIGDDKLDASKPNVNTKAETPEITDEKVTSITPKVFSSAKKDT